MLFQTVAGTFGNMRKPQEFIVLPTSDDNIVVQSDKSIGMFDPETGRGVLNTKGKYFPHLTPAGGAQPFTFPRDFITACLRACPSTGGETALAGGAVIVKHTVQVG
jgi:hypothetical protein